MGQNCSCVQDVAEDAHGRSGPAGESVPPYAVTPCPDPIVNAMVRRNNPPNKGQHYLLYKKGRAPSDITFSETDETKKKTTRLVKRKIKPESNNTTQVYAIRSAEERKCSVVSEQRPLRPEQRQVHATPTPVIRKKRKNSFLEQVINDECIDLTVDPYVLNHMSQKPQKKIKDWVCVSEEFDIHVCDTGLTHSECDALVQTTEQVCKGNYAAYTYAKQTLGCREFPLLAHACWEPVHRVTHSIWDSFPDSKKLQLDDREPHIVKYDISKKERQKLDMHTDKSEWTFLIALSDGCGLDYHGGGTYFEALNSTVHVQRGHALIFPGKLRHCGQCITQGLRFLLVGFLVDKQQRQSVQQQQLQITKQQSSNSKFSGQSSSDDTMSA